MFKILNAKRAQSTAEYAIVLALVITAVVAMQVYVRRGLQGRIKDTSDAYFGDAAVYDPASHSMGADSDLAGLGTGLVQYEPYYLESKFTTARNESEKTEIKDLGSSVGYSRTIEAGKSRVWRQAGGYQNYTDTKGAD